MTDPHVIPRRAARFFTWVLRKLGYEIVCENPPKRWWGPK